MATAEPPLARLDGDDRTGAVGEALELHAVADDGEVRGLALALHAASQLGLDEVALIGLDRVEAGSGAADQPARGRHPSGPTVIW